MKPPSASFWHMLSPKWITASRRLTQQRSGSGKGVTIVILGVLFWLAAYGILYRILVYFQGVEDIGDLLAAKLLGLILLMFLGILLLSNVITALSTFFLARDLHMFMAAPSDWLHVYLTKLSETLVHSSWMVALICVPIVVAYGHVLDGGPLYYVLSIGSLIPLFFMLSAVGSMVTLLLVKVFPARRTNDILGVIGAVTAGGVVLLFRLLQPEELAKPEGFRNLGEFLALLRGPTSPWLPSEWVADIMVGTLQGAVPWFALGLLWISALGCMVLGSAVHARFYAGAFTRSQEGADRYASRFWLGRVMRFLLRPLGICRSQLLLKDVRVFFRDTTQWSQLILLAVLIVVYIYNIRALPLYSEGVSFYFAHLVSFLNVGLAGFVLSAIAARFVFPAVSLEGPTFWLLRSSPLRVRDLLWTKYWVGTAPLVVLAVILTVGTNLLLEVQPAMMALSLVTIIAISFALAALALAFGAHYPQFDTENMAQIPTSLGGLLFMMSAIALIGGVLVLESWPVFTIFRHRFTGAELSPDALAVAAVGTLAALLICVLATVVPLRMTVKKVESFEF